jgi:cytidine deaminase
MGRKKTPNQSIINELFEKAEHAAKEAYVPYSNFRVGAAILTDDGTIYTGNNIENRNYRFTACAEEVALKKAVSEGKRSFLMLVMTALDSPVPLGPCGACRHMYIEFMSPDAPVYFKGRDSKIVQAKLGDMLPYDYFNSEVAEILRGRNLQEAAIPQNTNLSPREQGIYHLLITGKTAKEIASALHISNATVNFHIKNVYKRLGIKNRNQLFTKYTK